MTKESAKELYFKSKILPDLEYLLQFSLRLTKNGRDATRLMRESMAEANRSWNESMPEEDRKRWLLNILTKQFCDGFQQHARSLDPAQDDNVDESLVKNNRLFPITTTNAPHQSWLAGESDEYAKAMAGLPALCRSVMILSYLEGFTNREIADLAGVQPRAIESMLNRGRGFIQEKLFTHLTGIDGPGTVADQAAASG